jgi:hypothetical protein
MNKYKIFWACLFIFAAALSSCKKDRTFDVDIKDGVRFVHNEKPKYSEQIAVLEFIQQIGELEPVDQNYLFSMPISVASDEQGNIFILDLKESSIKKFSAEGKYLGRFGRPGQGPGELDNPMTIDCRQSTHLVTTMASQYHLFGLDGKYIERFQLPQYKGFDLRLMNEGKVVGFAMVPGGENTKENKVLNIFDIEGNVLHEFGEPFLVETAKSTWIANMPRIVVDNESNIYITFISQNRIEKYSDSGKLLIKIDRRLPFDLEYKYEKKKMEIRGKAVEYMDEVFTQVSSGIGIDSKGRIWVQANKREIPRDIEREDFVYTEYFEFEVYDEEGILLTKVPFPSGMERFDNWSLYNDRFYFTDPYGQACVYVYKTVWK